MGVRNVRVSEKVSSVAGRPAGLATSVLAIVNALSSNGLCRTKVPGHVEIHWTAVVYNGSA